MRRVHPTNILLALATVAALALPAAAEPATSLMDPRFALEPSPLLTAAEPRDLKSPVLSVGLSVGTPVLLSNLGGGLLILSGYPSQVNALSVLGMAVGVASPLALGAGQAYAGDPQRGAWVGLGAYGVMVGSTLLGLGVAYALAPKAMASGGQSAGMGYAFLALPVSAIATLGYTLWALADAHQTAVRQNEAVMNAVMNAVP